MENRFRIVYMAGYTQTCDHWSSTREASIEVTCSRRALAMGTVVVTLGVAAYGCSAAPRATLGTNPPPALPAAWLDFPDSPVAAIASGPGFVLENRTALRISDWSVGCVREANGLVTVATPLWNVSSSGSWVRGFTNRDVFDELNRLDTDPELYNRPPVQIRPCRPGTRPAITSVGSREGYKWFAEGTKWPTESRTQVQRRPLERILLEALTAKNPRVTRTRIVEVRSLGKGTDAYVLLGWGIRPDMKFEGQFEDELYGVFVLDSALTKIERILDIFPTPRWNDYLVSFEKVSNSEVVVVGAGSYGDQKLRHVYSLK